MSPCPVPVSPGPAPLAPPTPSPLSVEVSRAQHHPLQGSSAPAAPSHHPLQGSTAPVAPSRLLPGSSHPQTHTRGPLSPPAGARLRSHTQAPGPTRPRRPAWQVPQRPWAADQPSHQQRQTRPVHWPLSDNWSPYTQVPTKPYTLQDSPSLL